MFCTAIPDLSASQRTSVSRHVTTVHVMTAQKGSLPVISVPFPSRVSYTVGVYAPLEFFGYSKSIQRTCLKKGRHFPVLLTISHSTRVRTSFEIPRRATTSSLSAIRGNLHEHRQHLHTPAPPDRSARAHRETYRFGYRNLGNMGDNGHIRTKTHRKHASSLRPLMPLSRCAVAPQHLRDHHPPTTTTRGSAHASNHADSFRSYQRRLPARLRWAFCHLLPHRA